MLIRSKNARATTPARVGVRRSRSARRRESAGHRIRHADSERAPATGVAAGGIYARGKTCITEPAPTRDHTERMLTAFGYPVERSGTACVSGGGKLIAPIPKCRRIFHRRIFHGRRKHCAGFDIRSSASALIRRARSDRYPAPDGREHRAPQSTRRVASRSPTSACAMPAKSIEIPVALVPLAIDEFRFRSWPPRTRTECRCAGAEESSRRIDRTAVMADVCNAWRRG